ncbi:MAG: cytochrome b [Rhodobacteraceae bacterium]|nr:cytochrome b [Paracoccaceae bacterium]
MLKNSAESFGLISRLLHWGIAGLVVVMLSLGLRLEDMEPGLANLWLYGLHKSLGLLTLSLMVARILWHLYSPPPRPIGGGWQARVARATHLTLYLLLLAIPLTGWIGSAATGIDVVIFDRWTLPTIAPVSPDWEALGFTLHDALTKVLILLLFLHMGAALKREMDGDGTLRRIITGRAHD